MTQYGSVGQLQYSSRHDDATSPTEPFPFRMKHTLRFLTPLVGGVSVTIKARYHMNAAYDFVYSARHTNEPCVQVLYDINESQSITNNDTQLHRNSPLHTSE